MPVPDFSPGEVLTAAAMDSIGLWLVKTQTIGSGVATQEVTSCFSADYENYLVTVSGGTNSTNSSLNFRLGTTATGYRWTYAYTSFNNSVQGAGTLNDTSVFYVGFANTNGLTAKIDVTAPFLSTSTLITGDGGSVGSFAGHVVGVEPNSTSFTGLTIVAGSGTMTGGTIRVYGYRK